MEFDLTDRQRELRDLARQFRAEVIEPIEPHRREWIDDPDERFPWEVVEAGSRWGLRTLTVPRAYGGAEASVLELCLVVEELAAGDMGIAVVFDQTWKVCDMLAGLATPAQQDWFFPDFVADDRYLLAIGVAEPAHATDVHLSRMLEREGTRVGITTMARPDGDGWVIDGRKQMPSCGSTAKLIVVMAQTEPGRAVHDGCSYFLLPAGTPGFSVSRVWDKISQRLADNAGLVFDGCRSGRTGCSGPGAGRAATRRRRAATSRRARRRWAAPAAPTSRPWPTPGAGCRAAARSSSTRRSGCCWPRWPPSWSRPGP